MYTLKGFENIHEMLDWLNEHKIVKENIISIQCVNDNSPYRYILFYYKEN